MFATGWVIGQRHRLKEAITSFGRSPGAPVRSDAEQVLREPKRPRQRDQVAAGQHVRLETEAIPGQCPLKLDGKEPVVRTHHDANRDGRPRVKTADRPEDRVGLGALVRLTFGCDLGRDVV